uniref:SOCS box domain-containing protein n=1 Tax=Poecilia mexicana TaxID=48701 RepID=A0A3B3XQT5_9TELE
MDFTECYEDTVSSVAAAARSGCRRRLRRLIHRGCSVDSRDNRGWNPLHEAAAEGHQACVDLLLDNGANPNMACSKDWPQFPIHAAAEFGHISILRRLIEVTDRTCDRGERMVSPLYVAIHSDQTGSIQLLLKEDYSPDAQDHADILGFPSPLSLALHRTSTKPFGVLCFISFYSYCHQNESVKLLLSAGATLNAEEWTYALGTDRTDLLELILDHRRIPRPELRELVCVALSQVDFASSWLSVLLNKGLEPSLLLHPHMLEKTDSDVLNYLLEFVNWSTLSPSLKIILDQRRAEKTWEPHTYFDSVPCLFHLCRLKVREVLGPDQLMRTNVVQQLAVPSALHDFLKFRDIQELSTLTSKTYLHCSVSWKHSKLLHTLLLV